MKLRPSLNGERTSPGQLLTGPPALVPHDETEEAAESELSAFADLMRWTEDGGRPEVEIDLAASSFFRRAKSLLFRTNSGCALPLRRRSKLGKQVSKIGIKNASNLTHFEHFIDLFSSLS